MLKTAKEYRDQASIALRGHYATAIGLMLVHSLLMGLLTLVGETGVVIKNEVKEAEAE